MKHLILTITIIVTGTATGGDNMLDALKTYPETLIKTEHDAEDSKAFKAWSEQHIGTYQTVKIKWDGGHSGGYAEVEIDGEAFPVHVEFIYSGKLPKTGRQFKPRDVKCKTGNRRQHIKVTRTGKTITVSGVILKIKPILKCTCGKGDLITVKVKAERIK